MLHAALEMMEPEDFVGNLWHDWASRVAAPADGATEAAVTLEEMRASVAVLFRALGGAGGVEPAQQGQGLTSHRFFHEREVAHLRRAQRLT